MSDYRTDSDIEQGLTSWADEVAPRSAPGRLLESTFARTMGTGQRRLWPWHRLMPSRRGLSYSGSGFGFGIVVLTMIVVVAMAAGFVGGALRPTATPSPSPSPDPSASQSTLPAAIPVIAETTVATQDPIALASDGEFLWVLAAGGRIDRIDPATAAVTASATIGPPIDLYKDLAVNNAGLWASNEDNSTLYRVDPQTLAVDARIVAGLSPRGVLANADGVWVADVHGGKVLRIDPETNDVAATVKLGLDVSGGPSWFAEGYGSIWVDTPRNGTIDRIDPVTNLVQATVQASTEFTPCGIAIANDSAWVTSCWAGTLMARVDATSNTVVATIDMAGNGYNPAVIKDSVWVSVDGGTAATGKLIRIDPGTNTVDRVLVPSTEFGGGGDIVVAGGSVWVIDAYHNAVIALPMSAFEP